MEIERRAKQKELKEKEKEARRRRLAEEREALGEEVLLEEEEEEEAEEEEEEPLPEIFIPPTPSPILWGFYSGPGKFWVSLVSKNSKTLPLSLSGPGYCHCFPPHLLLLRLRIQFLTVDVAVSFNIFKKYHLSIAFKYVFPLSLLSLSSELTYSGIPEGERLKSRWTKGSSPWSCFVAVVVGLVLSLRTTAFVAGLSSVPLLMCMLCGI